MSKARATEHEEQKALIERVRLNENQHPKLKLLFAIPNGGLRHRATAGKLKAEGVKAGVPDLFLPVASHGCHGLFIELKAKGGTVTESQWAMLKALSEEGYRALIAVGHDEAWMRIMEYLHDR
jgi:hypothetical protein